MEINWITVAAQLVNFLILVWLLNRLLYGPITRAMKSREERIRRRLEDADNAKLEAEAAAQELGKERDELSSKKEAFLSAARDDAEKTRKSLENNARQDIEKDRQVWTAHLQSEKQEFLTDLQQRAAEEFFALAEAGFADLADEALEASIIRKFLNNLASLSDEEAAKLIDAAAREEFSGRIESRFPIAPEGRRLIEDCINKVVGHDMAIQYNETDSLVTGVRLRIGGQTAEWSIEKYLDTLRERLEGALPADKAAEDKRAAE